MKMKPIAFALLCASLVACATPSGASSSSALQDGSSSAPQHDSSLSASSASSEESSAITSEENYEEYFQKPIEGEDVTYKNVLNAILEERASKNYDGEQTSSGVLWLFCRAPEEEGREYVAADFPEIDVESIDWACYSLAEDYCTIKLTLRKKTKESVNAAVFALTENPYVISCRCLETPEYYVVPWMREGWTSPEITKSKPMEQGSLYDKYDVDFLMGTDEFKYDEKIHVLGYVWVQLRRSENGNGKTYAPSDFPGVGCNMVVEQRSDCFSNRVVVLCLDNQSLEGTTEAIYQLAENPLVYYSMYYKTDGYYDYMYLG